MQYKYKTATHLCPVLVLAFYPFERINLSIRRTISYTMSKKRNFSFIPIILLVLCESSNGQKEFCNVDYCENGQHTYCKYPVRYLSRWKIKFYTQSTVRGCNSDKIFKFLDRYTR